MRGFHVELPKVYVLCHEEIRGDGSDEGYTRAIYDNEAAAEADVHSFDALTQDPHTSLCCTVWPYPLLTHAVGLPPICDPALANGASPPVR
jgi:hypothetical protein